MELSREQLLQIIDKCLSGQKDTIETDDFTFEIGEGKVKVKEKENEKPKRWKPEMNEHFYVVGIGDGTEVEHWIWKNFDCDYALYEMGECFKTKEEAEFEVARRKFMKTFRDIAYEVNDPNRLLNYVPVWNGEYVDLFYSAGSFYFGDSVVSFTSEEAFHKAMKMVDQGELYKYYFGLPKDHWI
jgi:hypothetical protein